MQKLIVCLILTACNKLSAQKIFIHFSNAAVGAINTPVQVQITKPLPPANSYQLINQKTGKIIPAQLLDSNTLVFISEQKMPAVNYEYLLVGIKNTVTQPPVSIVKKRKWIIGASEK